MNRTTLPKEAMSHKEMGTLVGEAIKRRKKKSLDNETPLPQGQSHEQLGNPLGDLR